MSGIVLRFKTIFLLVGIVVFILSVYAEQYIELFDQQGNYKQDYDQLISNLRKDDVLKMPDGKRYKVVKTMSGGSVTSVIQAIPLDLKLNEGDHYVALRLPKQTDERTLRFYQYYFSTLDNLKDTKLGIPKFYIANKQYMAAEFIDHKYGGVDFLMEDMGDDDELWQKAAKSLKRFALENKNIVNVGDIKAEQLLYEEKTDTWRLIDWSDGIQSYNGENIREHLITYGKLSPSYAQVPTYSRARMVLIEINDQIQEERMLDYLKKRSTVNQAVSNLAQSLKSEEDYKKVFGEIIKNNNTSYNQAFIRYITRNDKELFTHFTNAESIRLLMNWMDKNIKGINSNNYPLLKAKLLDQAYMNRVIQGSEYVVMMDGIISKMSSSDEIDKLINEFKHRKILEEVFKPISPKGFLNNCLRVILGDF